MVSPYGRIQFTARARTRPIVGPEALPVIVIDPEALVIEIPVPAVNVAAV
jgi:hypothetical protein